MASYRQLVIGVSLGMYRRGVGRELGWPPEDYLSLGQIGLAEACLAYDPTKGAKFSSFATNLIRYSIVRALRESSPFPRSHSEQKTAIAQATNTLSIQNGRTPTEPEIARAAGLKMKKLNEFRLLESLAETSLDSGSQESEPNTYSTHLLPDPKCVDPAEAVTQADHRERTLEALGQAIERLSVREREVVSLYFYEGLTMSEIGEVLHVSSCRISQLTAGAVIKLRKGMSDSMRDDFAMPNFEVVEQTIEP